MGRDRQLIRGVFDRNEQEPMGLGGRMVQKGDRLGTAWVQGEAILGIVDSGLMMTFDGLNGIGSGWDIGFDTISATTI